jgi:hypothetical protein
MGPAALGAPSMMKRDWAEARAKVDLEGRCRNCGKRTGLEAAHVLAREYDRYHPVRDEGDWTPGQVHPDRIIPLCRHCHHDLQHGGKLDTLRLLTEAEQVQAVADVGSIERARSLLIPRTQREVA